MAMKEKTKERLFIVGVFGILIGAMASVCILVGYEDAIDPLKVNLKNVGTEPLPFTLYLDGEVVLTGVIQPNETVTYILHESMWVYGEDSVFTCSVQLPNTIYEREVVDGSDEYFLFD